MKHIKRIGYGMVLLAAAGALYVTSHAGRETRLKADDKFIGELSAETELALQSSGAPVPRTDSGPNTKVITYRSAAGDIPLTVDYDKGTITYEGNTIPIIVCGDVEIEGNC